MSTTTRRIVRACYVAAQVGGGATIVCLAYLHHPGAAYAGTMLALGGCAFAIADRHGVGWWR